MLVLEPVADLLGGEAGEDQVSAYVRFGAACVTEQVAAVLAPEGVRAGAESGSGGAGLGEQDEIELPDDQVEVGGDKGGETGRGRRAWAEGRRPAEHVLLQLTLAFVEQGNGQAALVSEPPVQRPLADTGLGGDVVHGHPADPPGGKQTLGRSEDTQPVACGVGAFPNHPHPENRQLGPVRRTASSDCLTDTR